MLREVGCFGFRAKGSGFRVRGSIVRAGCVWEGVFEKGALKDALAAGVLVIEQGSGFRV